MQVPGDQWPVFLYAGYDYDPEDPWKGLFRSPLLVSVRSLVCTPAIQFSLACASQAYKHVFTSPSSVEKETKATRSGNARIHGMRNVTLASVAYIATQVSIFTDLSFITTDAVIGPLFSQLFGSLFPFGHCDRL
jgi:hypothetical protein